jgi:hypothetical protein
MDDRSLYATILGIAAPWEVVRVELDDAAKAVHVWLEARSGTTFTCPECQTISPLHDHVDANHGALGGACSSLGHLERPTAVRCQSYVNVRIARAGSGVIEHSLRDVEVAIALEDEKPSNATREIVEVGRAITGSLENVLATVGEDRTEELPVGFGHAAPGMSRSRYVA